MQIWLNFFLINNFGSIWPFLFRNPKYQICLKAQAGNFIMNLNKKTLIGTSNTNSKSQAWIGPLWSPHIFETERAKIIMLPYSRQDWGHRGHDCMVVEFTTTYAIKRKPLGENHRPAARHWQFLSHNAVSTTLPQEWDSNSKLLWW